MEQEIEVIKENQEQEIEIEKENLSIGIIPEGTLNITENGIYDITNYENVDVETPTITLQTKDVDITENGEQIILPDESYDGISQLTINTNVESKGLDWTILGFDNTPDDILVKYNNTESIKDNWEVKTSYNSEFYNNKTIEYMPSTELSQATSIQEMFYGCTSLKEVAYLDTRNVTNMNNVFYNCTSLKKIDGMDTSSVTNMQSMFSLCAGLTELNLSSFDTSNVSSFYGMFNGCKNLIELDLSSFNPSVNTDTGRMFQNCTSLQKIDFRNFDFSKATAHNNMFGLNTAIVPTTCLIIVKDNTQKQWLNTNFSNYTNVKTLSEYLL